MTTTPKSIGEESLSESWVDVSSISPGRVTPVAMVGFVNATPSGQLSHIGEEYLRLLKEAQRESNQSSARVSLSSSRRDSRCDSPKSPPNSPNNELAEEEELKGIFINKESGGKDWVIKYWNANSDNSKQQKVIRKRPKLSFKNEKIEEKGIFSREVIYTLFLSNFISLLIGAGIGLWFSAKRSSTVISQFPLN